MRAAFQRAIAIYAVLTAVVAGCATAPSDPARSSRAAGQSVHVDTPIRANVARIARAQVGAPYRYGGQSPSGFDCSGLVIYSYSQAGVSGLPHSAAALERRAQPLDLREVVPGDLLFFHLAGRKASHVGIYLGNREFVHAPSGGKHVERVSFDHVYWGKQLGRAGRLTR
jgi:cell wall-associated NlpC family hydrolase